MPAFALAYSAEDQSVAHQLAGAVDSAQVPVHVATGRDNEGALLADQIGAIGGPAVLLITPTFLTNPNCLLHLESFLTGQRACFTVQQGVNLADRADRMRFVSHWQDRYIDLRRGLDTYGEAEQAAFDRYLQKIRETSIGVPSVLDRLGQLPGMRWKESGPAAASELAAFLTHPAPAGPAQLSTSGAAPVEELTDSDHIARAWEDYDAGQQHRGLEALQRAVARQPEAVELRYQYALMLALSEGRPCSGGAGGGGRPAGR